MSCSKWAYIPEICDGQPCPGDCDLCGRTEGMDEEIEEELHEQQAEGREG